MGKGSFNARMKANQKENKEYISLKKKMPMAQAAVKSEMHPAKEGKKKMPN